METKPRSPNYPSLSLREAVDRVRLLHEQVGQSPHSRDVVARGMGYSSLSGTSATAISALRKYGLLDGRADEIRVSDRAMAILHPHSDAERREALQAAALAPELFRELAGKFPVRVNDELIRNYLMRNKFTPSAVDGVISAFRETMEFVGGPATSYDSAPTLEQEPTLMPQPAFSATMPQSVASQMRPNPTIAAERQIGVNDLEGGEYVKIVATTGVETEDALDWAMEIIGRKRKELERLKLRQAEMVQEKPQVQDENNA